MTIGIDIRRCQRIARSECSAWSLFVSKRLKLAWLARRKLLLPASQPRSCCPFACRWHRQGSKWTKEPHEPFASGWLSRNFFLDRVARFALSWNSGWRLVASDANGKQIKHVKSDGRRKTSKPIGIPLPDGPFCVAREPFACEP